METLFLETIKTVSKKSVKVQLVIGNQTGQQLSSGCLLKQQHYHNSAVQEIGQLEQRRFLGQYTSKQANCAKTVVLDYRLKQTECKMKVKSYQIQLPVIQFNREIVQITWCTIDVIGTFYTTTQCCVQLYFCCAYAMYIEYFYASCFFDMWLWQIQQIISDIVTLRKVTTKMYFSNANLTVTVLIKHCQFLLCLQQLQSLQQEYCNFIFTTATKLRVLDCKVYILEQSTTFLQ